MVWCKIIWDRIDFYTKLIYDFFFIYTLTLRLIKVDQKRKKKNFFILFVKIKGRKYCFSLSFSFEGGKMREKKVS